MKMPDNSQMMMATKKARQKRVLGLSPERTWMG